MDLLKYRQAFENMDYDDKTAVKVCEIFDSFSGESQLSFRPVLLNFTKGLSKINYDLTLVTSTYIVIFLSWFSSNKMMFLGDTSKHKIYNHRNRIG